MLAAPLCISRFSTIKYVPLIASLLSFPNRRIGRLAGEAGPRMNAGLAREPAALHVLSDV
jgi:hypothetical protein